MAQIAWGRAHRKAAAAAVSCVGIGSLTIWQRQPSEEDENLDSSHNQSLPSSSSRLSFPYFNSRKASSDVNVFTTAQNVEFSPIASFPTTAQAIWWLQQSATAASTIHTTECEPKVDPGYPDLSRFGKHSYLKKYLTPEIYASLKNKKTSNQVTLEDMIQSGVSLPWGARPVRGCGIYAGDAESYKVFSKLLDPIVDDWHHLRNVRRSSNSRFAKPIPPPRTKQGAFISRQATNLNPGYILRQNLDPDGSYILQTRMRVARSIKGFPFSPTISREKRRQLESLIQECTGDFDDDLKGSYTKVMDMTNEQHDDWIHRHILFHDPDALSLSAGLGRDWPDARGIYMNGAEDMNRDGQEYSVSPQFMIWVNAEDHLRIITMSKGGDLLGVFTQLSKAIRTLEASLKKRGYGYESDPRLGFLNTSPENLGTALRASVFVKLPRLGKEPGFDELLARLRLESSTRFRGEFNATTKYTGIFDIANSERLGQSEVQLINTMINGVGRLIALEKRLEKGEKVDLEFIR